MDKYAVIACPNCEFVNVIEQGHKTTKCGRCGKQNKVKKLKKFATTNSDEKARLVASELRAKQSGMKEDFIEAYENGEMDMSQYEGISSPADWLDEDDGDDRSDKEVVRDAIGKADPATRENVIDIAVREGVGSSEDVEDILYRLRQQTEILLSSDGTFREL